MRSRIIAIQSRKAGLHDNGDGSSLDKACCVPLSCEQAPVPEEAAIISGEKQILPAVMQYIYHLVRRRGPNGFNDS